MCSILVHFCGHYDIKYEFDEKNLTFEDLANEINEIKLEKSKNTELKSQHISPQLIQFIDKDDYINKKTTLIKDYKEIHVELKIKHPCVMIIGETGVGKSQLCNLLSRSTTFPVSAESNSCTFQTTIREVLWSDKLPKYLPDEDEDEGENKDKDEDNKKEEEGEQDETDTLNIDPRIYENYAFTLLDAPGLSDSANKDSNHIQTMINKCKLVNKVSAFILVFNGKQPRLSSAVREMLKTFIQMFTKEYMNNIAVVFTNWSYDKKEIIKRKKAGMNEEKRKKDLTEFLIELGMPSFRDLPCFFIDSLPVGQNEAKIVYEELKKITFNCFFLVCFSL